MPNVTTTPAWDKVAPHCTAAWNAAPIVGRVVPRIGPLLGIMPDDSRDIDISDLSPLVGKGGGE